MTLTTWIIIWIVCGLICAIIASSKGHNLGSWFIIGILFGPLTILAVITTSQTAEKVEAVELTKGHLIKCPFCAETVKSDARICKHCDRELPKTTSNTQQIDKTQYNSAIIDGDLNQLKALIAVGGDISHIKDDLITMAGIYEHNHIVLFLNDLK